MVPEAEQAVPSMTSPAHSRVVAIVQARMGSQRLPGKVLRPLAGCPMLEWVLTRLARARRLDAIVLATTESTLDDPLAAWAAKRGYSVFRGSEQDVLSRYHGAAAAHAATAIVRVTADCPFIDPDIVDAVVERYFTACELDYACNFLPCRWYPRGLDVECFSRAVLEELHHHVQRLDWREHVTLGIYQQQDRYRCGGVLPDRDYSQLRWTVDTPEDWELATAIAEHITEGVGLPSHMGWIDILQAFQQHPEWADLNAQVVQKIT